MNSIEKTQGPVSHVGSLRIYVTVERGASNVSLETATFSDCSLNRLPQL